MKLFAPIVLVLAVAACNAETPASTETPPETSATQLPPAPVSTNTITAEGWGPLRIGMTRAEVTAVVGATATPNAAAEDAQACDLYHPANAPEGMYVMLQQDRLTSITLRNNQALKTDRGFGVGDTGAAIKGAYGSSAQAMPHRYLAAPAEYITVWTVGAPPNAATFVQNPVARGIRYETDVNGRVTAIHAGGDSIQNVEGCS